MRTIKIFLPLLFLSLISLCPFIPTQLDQESKSTEVTEHLPDIENPTPFNEKSPELNPDYPSSPTPSSQDLFPSPTKEPLIPNTLEEISIENIKNLQIIGEIPYQEYQPEHIIYSLDISNDGTKLAIRSENWENRNKSLLVWDLFTNSQLFFVEDSSKIFETIFSPDGKQLWLIRDGFLDQVDLQESMVTESISLPEFTGNGVAISPDGKFIMTGSYDSIAQNSTINFYELGSLDPYFSETMAYVIMPFHFSPDSRMCAGTSAEVGGSITKIWEVETGNLLMELVNYDSGPIFSADSNLAAFAKGNQFSIFSTESWHLETTFQNDNPSSTNFPRFLLAGDQILAIQQTASLTFNQVYTGEELLDLAAQVTIADYSPTLNVILTNTNLESIKIWGVLP